MPSATMPASTGDWGSDTHLESRTCRGHWRSALGSRATSGRSSAIRRAIQRAVGGDTDQSRSAQRRWPDYSPFVAHAPIRFTNFAPPMPTLDHLLGPKRDQHPNDDNPHLARELAPAVQRVWQVEVHATGPPATAA